MPTGKSERLLIHFGNGLPKDMNEYTQPPEVPLYLIYVTSITGTWFINSQVVASTQRKKMMYMWGKTTCFICKHKKKSRNNLSGVILRLLLWFVSIKWEIKTTVLSSLSGIKHNSQVIHFLSWEKKQRKGCCLVVFVGCCCCFSPELPL